VSDEALADVANAAPTVAGDLQRRAATAEVSRALRAALGSLPVEDRRLLRLRFVDGVSMADISRRLGMRQVQVYPRFVRMLAGLRAALEARGVHAADVDTQVGMDVVSST
jgi:RNA polymerase sigma factor (sigma-70 family)